LLYLRNRKRREWAGVVDSADDQILHDQTTAAIRNVRRVDSDCRIQKRTAEMSNAANQCSLSVSA
jgi:hypothetical protein